MLKKSKLNNAQMLRLMKEINDDFKKQNDEPVFTENFEKFLDEILEQGGDNDLLVNALLNKKLKPCPKEFNIKI